MKYNAISTGIVEQCDISDASIDELQLMLDDFFVTWVDLISWLGWHN